MNLRDKAAVGSEQTPPAKKYSASHPAIPPQFAAEKIQITSQSGGTMEIEIEVDDDMPLASWSMDSPVSAPPSEPVGRVLTLFDRTLIVLDYDDTLFPTTQFCEDGYSTQLMCRGAKLTAKCQQQVLEVEDEALRLLGLAQQNGSVVLLTNAEPRWLELSSHYYMPRLERQLQASGLSIVYGRDWQSHAPTQPGMWKQLAFESELQKLRNTIGQEAEIRLVSIGDSTFERNAAEKAGKQDGNVQVKTIKLVDLPNPSMLRQELGLLVLALGDILGREGALAVDMELRYNKKPAPLAPSLGDAPPMLCD